MEVSGGCVSSLRVCGLLGFVVRAVWFSLQVGVGLESGGSGIYAWFFLYVWGDEILVV